MDTIIGIMAKAMFDSDPEAIDWEETATAVIAALRKAGFVIVPREPDTQMLRALLVHRGFDPDANEKSLDRLGKLELATMGAFLSAYRAMLAAAPDQPNNVEVG